MLSIAKQATNWNQKLSTAFALNMSTAESTANFTFKGNVPATINSNENSIDIELPSNITNFCDTIKVVDNATGDRKVCFLASQDEIEVKPATAKKASQKPATKRTPSKKQSNIKHQIGKPVGKNSYFSLKTEEAIVDIDNSSSSDGSFTSFA